MEATNASNKSLFGDGNETTYKIDDDDEDSSNEDLQPCPKKRTPSKVKKVAIKSSMPNSRITLKSNSKTTTKSSNLSGEKVNSLTLQMNFEEHLHKRMYFMFVFVMNSELSSFVYGINFFCF